MATDQEVKDMITRTVLRKEYHEEEFIYWKNFLKELEELDRIEIWDKEEEEKFQDMELIFYSEPLDTKTRMNM